MKATILVVAVLTFDARQATIRTATLANFLTQTASRSHLAIRDSEALSGAQHRQGGLEDFPDLETSLTFLAANLMPNLAFV